MQFTIKLILIIFCNLCGNLFAANKIGSELGDFDIKLDQVFGLSRLAMHKLRLEHPAFELLLEEAIRGDAELKVAVDNLGFMVYGKALRKQVCGESLESEFNSRLPADGRKLQEIFRVKNFLKPVVYKYAQIYYEIGKTEVLR
jgi:hypothetical protein